MQKEVKIGDTVLVVCGYHVNMEDDYGYYKGIVLHSNGEVVFIFYGIRKFDNVESIGGFNLSEWSVYDCARMVLIEKEIKCFKSF